MLRNLVRHLPRGQHRVAHLITRRNGIYEMVGPLSGLRMKSNTSDPFQAEMACGVYQSDLIDEIKSLVKPGHVVLTAGAHLGYMMLAMARMGATVIGCECDPNLTRQCQENLSLNDEKVRLVPVGLGSREAEREMNISVHPGQSSFSIAHYSTEKRTVRIRRRDDVLRELGIERIDGLLLDVEGWECEVLAGLSRTLAQTPSWAVIESFEVALQNAGASGDQLRSQIEGIGWRIEKEIGADLICRMASNGSVVHD